MLLEEVWDCKKNKKSSSSSSKNKKRFSDEQIRSLEVTFESETKLEPKKKMQIAKELDLQPRQVAIWFQNRRARWKFKHMHKQYNILLADYNNLANQFESLKKEKLSLLTQLQKLKNEMKGKCEEEQNGCSSSQIVKETAGNNYSTGTDGESSDYTRIDFGIMTNILSSDDDDGSIKPEMLGLQQDDREFLKMVEPAAAAADSSLTSADDWGSLDSDDIINQSPDSFQWWDFWS